MIDEATIHRAVELLLAAAPEGSRVILFGSHARGTAGEDSDIDFLVIEPEVKARMQEAARLDHALRSIHVSIDVLVISEAAFEEWKDTPNSVVYYAAKEGRQFREVA